MLVSCYADGGSLSSNKVFLIHRAAGILLPLNTIRTGFGRELNLSVSNTRNSRPKVKRKTKLHN